MTANGASVAWCGREDGHRRHGKCGGVRWLPSCGLPWSVHPQTRDGEPYCATATCPGGGPGSAGRTAAKPDEAAS